MHWVVQDGFFHDTSVVELVDLLGKYEIPHTIVKVVPFVGEIIPDIAPEGNVICFGSYSMRHAAKAKGWIPGVFDLDQLAETIYSSGHPWAKHTLNGDCVFCKFGEVLYVTLDWDEFFMRPVSDSKVFAGNVFTRQEYLEWREKVVILEEDDGTSLRADTEVLVSLPKNIQSEYRLFVIGDSIVTASQYKINGYVKYDSLVDDDILEFGRERVAEIHFADAYCLDLCRTSDGIKIVEVNTINSAGMYHGNVSKIIQAFEDLYGIG